MLGIRRMPLVTALVMLVAMSCVTQAQASVPDRFARDSVSVTGYNFEVNREADVVVGDPDAAVRIDYTAGRMLTDGTVRILMPRDQWPTTLRTLDNFTGEFPFSPADQAGVSVLPTINLPLSVPSCTGTAADGVFAPGGWSVAVLPGVQVITVRHVSCAAGAHLVVRLKGVTAPSRVGTAYLPIIATAPRDVPRLTVGTVPVRPRPSVVLTVQAPSQVVAGQEFFVGVTPSAFGQPGTVSYTGAVAVVSDPIDCTLTPRNGSVALEFAANPGVPSYVTVELDQTGVHELVVFDVQNKAVTGISGPITVLPGDVDGGVCPASFH